MCDPTLVVECGPYKPQMSKNIDLQIKNIKTCFFHFYKNIIKHA